MFHPNNTLPCSPIEYSIKGYKIPLTFSNTEILEKEIKDLLEKFELREILFASSKNNFEISHTDEKFDEIIAPLKHQKKDNSAICTNKEIEEFKSTRSNYQKSIQNKGKNKEKISAEFYFVCASVMKVEKEFAFIEKLQINQNKNYEKNDSNEKKPLLVEEESRQ